MSENSTESVETNEEAAEPVEPTTTEDTQESSSGQPKPPSNDKIYITSYVADEQFEPLGLEKSLEQLRDEYSKQIHQRLIQKEALSLMAAAEHINRSYYLDWSYGARELMQLTVRQHMVQRGTEIARKSSVENIMRVDPTAGKKKRR